MTSKFDPILIAANGKHYLCTHLGKGTVRIYDASAVILSSGALKLIDDWCRNEFSSYDEYRAYCTNAVKNNPTPAY